ncbi:GNAT family N-acetyltransferase [Pseudotenacibaculum sp. MALMAid0570]|uniref:GNAT family N-acetyltransferase n=1 Tax=Pseudotenacibaculum sp. MALMAid0570 TaxID=3143938 RepID=UPI0032E032F6
MSKYRYEIVKRIPKQKTIQELLVLYKTLFDDAKLAFFVDRIHAKEDLVTILCYHDDLLVGFKLGYRYNDTTFYSWVGGVLDEHRKQGIAQKLMELQHDCALKKRYEKVRTKSMNRFKPMIILNLKNGFDIVSVYTNESEQTKIIFEKILLNLN